MDDPTYIEGADRSTVPQSQNVALLSGSVSASLLAQYASYCTAPGGMGDPGPLQYWLSTHHLERLNVTSKPYCAVEAAEGNGDLRLDQTGRHEVAEQQRQLAKKPGSYVQGLRTVDWLGDTIVRRLGRST